jgi:hypothetical protein
MASLRSSPQLHRCILHADVPEPPPGVRST